MVTVLVVDIVWISRDYTWFYIMDTLLHSDYSIVKCSDSDCVPLSSG